jgi:hypothetical protein
MSAVRAIAAITRSTPRVLRNLRTVRLLSVAPTYRVPIGRPVVDSRPPIHARSAPTYEIVILQWLSMRRDRAQTQCVKFSELRIGVKNAKIPPYQILTNIAPEPAQKTQKKCKNTDTHTCVSWHAKCRVFGGNPRLSEVPHPAALRRAGKKCKVS